MTTWANCVVYNEENFVWFSIMSVVDYVDKILVWDTGSEDKTTEIIQNISKIYKDKISFKEVGKVNKFQFTKIRQRMLKESECDWILILDGDEVWWQNSIRKVVETIEQKGHKIDAIINPFYNMVGDLFHYQEETAGQYKLLGKRGHLSIKAINKSIKGLYWANPYGIEGLFDKNNIPIQHNRNIKAIFLDAPFMHLTHLLRSSHSNKKFKHDVGITVSKEFKHPEVFNKERPEGVPSPFFRRSKRYNIMSWVKFPFQFIWRGLKTYE